MNVQHSVISELAVGNKINLTFPSSLDSGYHFYSVDIAVCAWRLANINSWANLLAWHAQILQQYMDFFFF